MPIPFDLAGLYRAITQITGFDPLTIGNMTFSQLSIYLHPSMRPDLLPASNMQTKTLKEALELSRRIRDGELRV